MKDATLNTFDLETLFQRGMELNVWKIMDNSTKIKTGMFGAKVYNPADSKPDDWSMGECSYAPTTIEAINLAIEREI